MTSKKKLQLFLTCSLPLALSAMSQTVVYQYPNGNPGDWSDSATAALLPVYTSATGGPGGSGFTVLHEPLADRGFATDNGPYTFFNAPPNPSSPGPAFHAVSQSIAVYLNPALTSEQSGGVVIDETVDSTVNTPQYSTPQLWGAEEEFAVTGTAGGLNVDLWPGGPSIASDINASGWYNFTMTWTAGAGASPVDINLAINDLSAGNALVGSISTTAQDAGVGTYESENLDGSGYIWFTEWSGDFGYNHLAVADVDAVSTPDGGSALMLLGSSLVGVAWLRRRSNRG
ncbi:MAG: hypothetical protein ABSA47_15860 [Verrucomicrobiota bacterium]|jgi:hypothetical protein